MEETEADKITEDAFAAASYAREIRSYHRKRTEKGSRQRKEDVQAGLDRIKEAMAPIRSATARFPFEPQGSTSIEHKERVRAASRLLQEERRKLWKMKPQTRSKK